MYYVYILWSQVRGRYYVGSTDDLARRLQDHNGGNTPSTKGGRPWIRVYDEQFDAKSQALSRERQIKSWKSAKSVSELIKKQSG